jgi:SAM-dependent methyltransferase
MSRHLDVGCGGKPRNPYGQRELVGIDLAPQRADTRIHQANLAVDPIPFAADHFDSVSAYDFLEHVPRVLATPDGRGTRLPFVELMNEIWRVLRPGGLFYAQTPVYPSREAFDDPTHVNHVGMQTSSYFAVPWLFAKPYGFHGAFVVLRVHGLQPRTDYEPRGPGKVARVRNWLRPPIGRCSHVLWELQAVKPAPGEHRDAAS